MRPVFVGLILLTINSILPAAEMSIDERVQLAMRHAAKAICYCDEVCTCPCGPDCPCGSTYYTKTASGVKKMKRGGCSCGADCNCTSGQCSDPNCPSFVTFSIRTDPITAASQRATREGKDLVVHVCHKQPWARQQWPTALHVETPATDMTSEPGAFLMTNGDWYWYSEASRNAQLQAQQQAIYQQHLMQQQMMMQSMMRPMMGGMCGGGGCSSCH